MLEDAAYAATPGFGPKPKGSAAKARQMSANRRGTVILQQPISTRNNDPMGKKMINLSQDLQLLNDSQDINDISGIVKDISGVENDTSFVMEMNGINKQTSSSMFKSKAIFNTCKL